MLTGAKVLATVWVIGAGDIGCAIGVFAGSTGVLTGDIVPNIGCVDGVETAIGEGRKGEKDGGSDTETGEG